MRQKEQTLVDHLVWNSIQRFLQGNIFFNNFIHHLFLTTIMISIESTINWHYFRNSNNKMKQALNNNQSFTLQKLQFTITSHSYTITQLLFDYFKLYSLSFYPMTLHTRKRLIIGLLAHWRAFSSHPFYCI